MAARSARGALQKHPPLSCRAALEGARREQPAPEEGGDVEMAEVADSSQQAAERPAAAAAAAAVPAPPVATAVAAAVKSPRAAPTLASAAFSLF